jgi:D-glycero-alpha-D-manno-heptose 1-phosphate guanylyltransferase
MIKTAIILAGGFGTRLSQVVSDVPKALAPIAGLPFLEYLFSHLLQNNISNLVLSLHYRAEQIIEFSNQYTHLFNIQYVLEDGPLGTGGAIKRCLNTIDVQNILILNGDTFFNADYQLTISPYIDSIESKIAP